ncbi:MAG: HEAT repeat domain-containing protein [Thermoguttaceae bacterium]|nr:HEAT repeat domain-containing protein [Thermoguttaceae bacterium]MDW8036727.1 HEAT repeat domain-containing protein [Thermoguttaceae bacterium]
MEVRAMLGWVARLGVLLLVGVEAWVVAGERSKSSAKKTLPVLDTRTADKEALHPEHPEVQAAIAKAIRFLESERVEETRLGGRALVALALLKHGARPNHSKVQAAVKAIQYAADRLPKVDKDEQGRPLPSPEPPERRQPIDIYSTGLSIILLCQLDPSEHGATIQKLLDYLYSVQKDQGAWGYQTGDNAETCDTSMTQYAILATWEAAQVGFRVADSAIEDALLWLLKTQDPSGQYGYQGKVAATVKNLEKQSGCKPSMTAAGMGSLYIAADLLGLLERVDRPADLPPALKEVRERPTTKSREKIDPAALRAALARGNHWMDNNLDPDWGPWTHYYYYAVERYYSFREEAEGNVQKSPRWYQQIARQLLRTQADNGVWKSQCGEVVDTAFGVLFLLRSTRKSIERAKAFGGGMMIAGRGLPRHTAAVEVREGKVVPKTLWTSADRLLAALEDPDSPDYKEAVEWLQWMPWQKEDIFGAAGRRRLRELAGMETPEARLAAVRAIAATGRLEDLPVLIDSLTDPADVVVEAALEALHRFSRRVEPVQLSDPITPELKRHLYTKWKAWYQTLRPEVRWED